MRLKIEQGRLYDPENQRNGEVEDIYVHGGVISPPFRELDETLCARDLVVLPGAIDPDVRLCCFALEFYAYKCGLPSLQETAAAYAQLGYTHLNESLMTPITATSVKWMLSSLPIVDTSAYLTLPATYVNDLIRGKKYTSEEARILLSDLLKKYRATGLKIQQPFVRHADRRFMHRNLKTARLLSFLNTINFPGRIIIETDPMLLEHDHAVLGRFHLARLAMGIDNQNGCERASSLIKSGVAADIGLPFEYPVHRIRIGQDCSTVTSVKTEVDLGFSDSVSYYFGKSLSVPDLVSKILDDPSNRGNLAMSVDCIGHVAPLHYPVVLRRLMDEKFGFSLADIIKMTRTVPARQLGFGNKGHLGIGAVADIAIYDPHVFTESGPLAWKCRHLIKSGKIVIKNYRMTGTSSSSHSALFPRFFG